MGRPRKPVEQKRLTGRRAGVDSAGRALPEPVVILSQAAGAPQVPATLGETGRAEWDRLWTAGRTWLSPQIDVMAVTRYCEQHDRRALMLECIAADGPITLGHKGQPRQHPLIGEVRALEAEMRRMEIELGFTPAARSKLGYAEVRRVSKMDELMQRRAKGSAQ